MRQYGNGRYIWRLAYAWPLLLLALLMSPSALVAQDSRAVPLLFIDGAIGPATADYIGRGIERGAEEGAPFVLIQMDTPGGLDTAMRAIIRDILRSPVPVVTLVGPQGARAASAGTFILYASHIAAMAPGTNVGAATPVRIGSSPFDSPEKTPEKSAPRSAGDTKAMNDAIAYIRSLAELRGRNATWAEAAVRDAASLSATDAAAQNIIDMVADDRQALLSAIDGREIIAGGRTHRLDTADLTIVEVPPNWRTHFLATITDPNIAVILMMIGVYGLLFELMNPGALFPGTIGGISLLLGLYALALLPVNYAGVALILLGIALMAAEAFSPSFGILGIGGIAAFVLGGAILIETDIPQLRVSMEILGIVAIGGLALMLFVARLALSARRTAVTSGPERMIGAPARILEWRHGRGHVLVHGERWQAVGAAEMPVGATVRVDELDGLVLHISRTDENNTGHGE